MPIIFATGTYHSRTVTVDLDIACSVHDRITAFAFALGMTFDIEGLRDTTGLLLSVNGDDRYVSSGTGGTITFAATTEEVIYAYGLVSGEGSALRTEIKEVVKPGTYATGSLTIGGETWLASSALAPAWPTTDTTGIPTIAVPPQVIFEATCTANTSGLSGAGSISGAASVSLVPTLTYSPTGTTQTYSLSGSGTRNGGSGAGDESWSFTASSESGPQAVAEIAWSYSKANAPGTSPAGTVTGDPFFAAAAARAESYPDRAFSLDVLLQDLDVPSGSTFDIYLETTLVGTVTGTGTISQTQKRHNWYAGGVVASSSEYINEHLACDPRYRLPGGSVDIGLLLVRGWSWDALGIEHDDSTTLDDGSALTIADTETNAGEWTAGSGGSVAVVSGAIKLTGAAGKTLTRSFSELWVDGLTPHISRRLYAYPLLTIRLRCSAGPHTIMVEIADNEGNVYDPSSFVGLPKRWSITTGVAATWTDITIDLSAEETGLSYGTYTSRQHITPLEPSAQGGHFAGAHAVSLKFTGLGAGDYEVDSLTLSDGAGDPTLHALAQVMPTGDGSTEITRRLVAITRAQQTLELFGDGTLLDCAKRLTWPPPTIFDPFAGPVGLDALTGWNGTDLAPGTGTLLNAGLSIPETLFANATLLRSSLWPARFLTGEGLTYSGSGWAHWYDDGAITIDTTTGATLPAQWLINALVWDWPEALASLPGGSSIGAGVILGTGGVWGRVLDTSRAGESGVSVTATLGSGTRTATSGTDGWYLLPDTEAGIAGGASADIQAGTGSGPIVSRTISRGRQRVVLLESIEYLLRWLTGDRSDTGRMARYYRSNVGGIVLGLCGDVLGATWAENPITAFTSGQACLRYDRSIARLWLSYESGGAILLRYTDDEGASWSMATTITTSGSYGTFAVSPTGAQYHFWIDGGAIKSKVIDSQGNTMVATLTAVASGVADDSLCAIYSPDTGYVHLSYANASGVITSVKSTDGGLTYS